LEKNKMAGQSYFPKADGNILYASDVNQCFYGGVLGSVWSPSGTLCGSTAVQVLDANSLRKSCIIRNMSSLSVFVGDSDVALNDGKKLNTKQSIYIKGDTGEVYVIGSGNNLDIRTIEVL
jgi:hypothetical protein